MKIQSAEYEIAGTTYSFKNYIEKSAQIYERKVKVNTPVDAHCQSCQYRVKPSDITVLSVKFLFFPQKEWDRYFKISFTVYNF